MKRAGRIFWLAGAVLLCGACGGTTAFARFHSARGDPQGYVFGATKLVRADCWRVVLDDPRRSGWHLLLFYPAVLGEPYRITISLPRLERGATYALEAEEARLSVTYPHPVMMIYAYFPSVLVLPFVATVEARSGWVAIDSWAPARSTVRGRFFCTTADGDPALDGWFVATRQTN